MNDHPPSGTVSPYRRARARLAREGPELARLLSRARRHMASSTHGLSEQVEQLGQRLASVRTKADRLLGARGDDLALLVEEIEEAWRGVERCASRIRTGLGTNEHA